MIMGHNFNNTSIPDPIRKHFKKVLKDGSWLAGVATTATDRDTMLIVGNNGTRVLTVVEVRDRMGVLYGVYVRGSFAGERREAVSE